MIRDQSLRFSAGWLSRWTDDISTVRTLCVDSGAGGGRVLYQDVTVIDICATGRARADWGRTLDCHGWVRDKGERACDTLVESEGDALYTNHERSGINRQPTRSESETARRSCCVMCYRSMSLRVETDSDTVVGRRYEGGLLVARARLDGVLTGLCCTPLVVVLDVP